MAARKGTKDFYKVLKVEKSASKADIKEAYRKLALALHPDRHDGCDMKAEEFKEINEAYDTLSDISRKQAYDNMSGYDAGNRRRPPPANYRKVYSPRAPPGFKTFDQKRHFDMHYGDGMMREEFDRVEQARKRAEAASKRFSGYDYRSPLGKGFSFDENWSANPYSKRSPQGPPKKNGVEDIEYEESYYELNTSKLHVDSPNRVVQRKEVLRNRMDARRRMRRRERGDPLPNYDDDKSGCVVM
jgi:DnaJ-class molecular chaperone